MPAPALLPFTRFYGVAAAVEFGSIPRVYVNNLKDDGLFIEWKCEKTVKSDPDKLELSVYNMRASDRKALQAYASTFPGVPELEYVIKFSIGWDGQVMQLFEGNIRHIEADRSAKTGDRINAVTFCRALDGVPTKELPPGGGSKFALGTKFIIADILGRLKLRVSPDALKAIGKAAAKLPYDAWHNVYSINWHNMLDAMMEMLGLSWTIQGKEFIVFEQGVNTKALAVHLSPKSGLISYSIKDNGDVKIKAMANPALVPGGPVFVYAHDGSKVTGGEMRVQKVTFEGNTDGKSLMSAVAKKPKGL